MRGYTILGTTPDRITDFGSVVTFVRADYDAGRRVFRLHWKDDFIAGVGGSAVSQPVRIQVLPGDNASLVGYHIPTGHAVEIRHGRAKQGSPETLTLPGGAVFRRAEP